MAEYTPALRVSEIGDQVRIAVDGLGYADGPTLQDAADELVLKILAIVMALRGADLGRFSSVCRPDIELVTFLWELGDIAARGGDIRDRLFGPDSIAA